MRTYSATEIDDIARRHRDEEKAGMLAGFAFAVAAGFVAGILVMVVFKIGL